MENNDEKSIQLKYDNFKLFFNLLKSDNLFNATITSYYDEVKVCFDNFKLEIESNGNDFYDTVDIDYYQDYLLSEIFKIRSEFENKNISIDQWCKKYKCTYPEIMYAGNSNELFYILNNYLDNILKSSLEIEEVDIKVIHIDFINHIKLEFIEKIHSYVNNSYFFKQDAYSFANDLGFRGDLSLFDESYSHFSNLFPTIEIENNYIILWENCEITLDQWLSNKYTDILRLYWYDKDIIKHTYFLYIQFVDRIFDSFRINLDKIAGVTEKLIIAKRDFQYLDDLLKGNINDLKQEFLLKYYKISDYKIIVLQYEEILRNNYPVDDRHISSAFNIHSSECIALTEAIIKFHKYLSALISEKNNTLHYQKHPTSAFDLMNLPKEILKYYQNFEYKYINIKGYGVIPIPNVKILSLADGFNINDFNLVPMDMYAKGFLFGYNEPFQPFIDTPDIRKQYISNILGSGASSFCQHKGVPVNERYKSDDFFQDGIYEGKRYKAWEKIFETPDIVIDKELKNNDILKIADIDNPVFQELTKFFYIDFVANYSIIEYYNSLVSLFKNFQRIVYNYIKELDPTNRIFYLKDLKIEIDSLIKIKDIDNENIINSIAIDDFCSCFNTTFPEILNSPGKSLYDVLQQPRKSVSNVLFLKEMKSVSHKKIYIIFCNYIFFEKMKIIHSFVDETLTILFQGNNQIEQHKTIIPLSNINTTTVDKSDSLNKTVSDYNNTISVDSEIQISSTSTLYQPFQVLKDYFEVPYDKVYNEDKQTYSYSYLYGNYINKLDALSNSSSILQNVKKIIYDNAFNMQQIEILISNLFNIAEKYGEHEIGFFSSRIVQFNKSNSNNNESNIYINELEKSIPIIYKTRELLLHGLEVLLHAKKAENNTQIKIIANIDKNTTKPRSNNKNSFELKDYKEKHTKITDLHNSLNNSAFIDSKDIYNFKKLFNNTPLDKKIQWVGSPSELYYFIYYLSRENLIKRSSIWDLAPILFVLPNNPDYDLSKLSTLKKPKRADLIESAINIQLK